MTPEQMHMVATHAAQQVHQRLNAAAIHHVMSNEYADVYADPVLSAATAARTHELKAAALQSGHPHHDLELLREAGRQVRDRYLKPHSEPAPQPPARRHAVQDNYRPERAGTSVDRELDARHRAVTAMQKARGQSY